MKPFKGSEFITAEFVQQGPDIIDYDPNKLINVIAAVVNNKKM